MLSTHLLRDSSTKPLHDETFDLSHQRLDETPPQRNELCLVERLDAYRILPPEHASLPPLVLEHVEQLFITWFELADDGSRRSALSYLFSNDDEVRATLLAIVPLYYDTLFFDERTPTRDLIEISLVAHAKWRRWLTASS